MKKTNLLLLPFVLLLMSACQDFRYPYRDKWYADYDSVLDEGQTNDYCVAQGRLLAHRGRRPLESLSAKLFGLNKYDCVARNADRMNVSGNLYLLVKASVEQNTNQPEIHLNVTTNCQNHLPDGILWAVLHSGSGTHEWRPADCRRIRRMATRIQPRWRRQGFSLEEMDRIAEGFRGAHRQAFEDLGFYCRETVLIEDEDGRLRAVNALRIVRSDTDGDRLRYIDFHENNRLGRRGWIGLDRVKYIYLQNL